MTTVTQAYKNKILRKLSSIDIPGYMLEEMTHIVQNLHYYRLRNMQKNIHLLMTYLLFLDEEYHSQLSKIVCDTDTCKTQVEQNTWENVIHLEFFVSERSKTLCGEPQFLDALTQDNIFSKVQILILGIQGLLLLMTNEFCLASSARTSLMQMRLAKKAHKKSASI